MAKSKTTKNTVKNAAKNAVKKPAKNMLKKTTKKTVKKLEKKATKKIVKKTVKLAVKKPSKKQGGKQSGFRGLAITNKGIEDIAALEIKELIGQKSEVKEGAVIFPIKTFEDLCLLSYKGQSFSRILLLLDEFQSKEQDLQKLFENLKTDFTIAEKLVKKNNIRFACRCGRIGEQEFQKQDVERALGDKIYKTYPNVDLSNPNLVFYVYLFNDKYYLGIDFSGEIDKREYRIYSTPKEMKATIAYALLRIAGYDKKKSILDPFAGSGTIPIEAAMFATNTSPRYFKKNELQFTKFDTKLVKFNFSKYEKLASAKNIYSSDASLQNLKSAEKNAKVGNVNKFISVSRIDIEWIDTKFDEHELDMIVTSPIESTKEQDEKEITKMYKEFFYQIEYVMKKKCKLVLIVKKPISIIGLKETSKEYFKATHERQVSQGKETLNVIVFERK